MFCANCGKEIKDTASFCSGCGAKQEVKKFVQKKTANKPKHSLKGDEYIKDISYTRTSRRDLQKMYADFVLYKTQVMNTRYSYDQSTEDIIDDAKFRYEWDKDARKYKHETLMNHVVERQRGLFNSYSLSNKKTIEELREQNQSYISTIQVQGTISQAGVLTINDRYIAVNNYKGNENIKSVIIESACEGIGEYAFAECPNLERVVFKCSNVIIPRGMFSGCTKLRSVTLTDDIKAIDECAFMNCKSLASLTIPYGVMLIEERAFMGCSGLVDILVPDSVFSIRKEAFAGCSNITDFDVPIYLDELGVDAFKDINCVWIPEIWDLYWEPDDYADCSIGGAKEIKHLAEFLDTGIHNEKDSAANAVLQKAKTFDEISDIMDTDLLKVFERKRYEKRKAESLKREMPENSGNENETVDDLTGNIMKDTGSVTSSSTSNSFSTSKYEGSYERYQEKDMNVFDYLLYGLSFGTGSIGKAILMGFISLYAWVAIIVITRLVIFMYVGIAGIVYWWYKKGLKLHKNTYPERYDVNGKLIK